MKYRKENGITILSLAVTVVAILILSFTVTLNLRNNTDLQQLVYLRSDIENLTQKVSDFYNEYGELPGSIQYKNIENLSNILSSSELSSKFYVIDLQAMQGVSLHFGKDYQKIKDLNEDTANKCKDLYIVNEQTHNVFYVKGILIKDGDREKIYYTDKQSEEDFLRTSVANAPELLEGMKKIMFESPTDDEKGQVIQETDEKFDENKWYSYEDKRWANAQTQDGSMWVWIPRFAYKIEGQPEYNGDGTTKTAGLIRIKFLIGTSDEYYDANGNKKTAQRQKTANDYIVHPAFTNEASTGYANGGWNEELSGIWVAKFEAGYSQDDDSNDRYPTFKGINYSMGNVSYNEAFNISKTLTETANIYGFTDTADSHLMKDSEWGAIAYLAQSQYGLGEDDIQINNIKLNNVSINFGDEQKDVHAVTGVTTGSTEEGAVITTIDNINNTTKNTPTSEGVYTWDQKGGQGASTTGNIYGIYDLSGGLWETTASYIADERNTEYTMVYKKGEQTSEEIIDVAQSNYEMNNKIYGTAIHETSLAGAAKTSWFEGDSLFPNTDQLFMIRGGWFDSGASAGMFSFNSTKGEANYPYGFRCVLLKK